MPPLETRTHVNGTGYIPQGNPAAPAAPTAGAQPQVDARNVDGIDRARPAAPDAQVGAAAPRKTIAQRLGSLGKGLLKGAATIGLAAGLIVGGGYVMKDVAPQLLQQQIEAPAVPGGVQDPSNPGGQGPPVQIVPGENAHRTPSLPGADKTGTTAPATGTTGPVTNGPGTSLPQPPTEDAKPPVVITDRAPVVRDTLPADGGQTPADLRGRLDQPRTEFSVRPGTEEVKPDVQQPAGPDLSGFKPSLGTTTDAGKPIFVPQRPQLRSDGIQGATTDPGKATVGQPQLVEKPQLAEKPQIDTTRLPTFKPHMLRGQ